MPRSGCGTPSPISCVSGRTSRRTWSGRGRACSSSRPVPKRSSAGVSRERVQLPTGEGARAAPASGEGNGGEGGAGGQGGGDRAAGDAGAGGGEERGPAPARQGGRHGRGGRPAPDPPVRARSPGGPGRGGDDGDGSGGRERERRAGGHEPRTPGAADPGPAPGAGFRKLAARSAAGRAADPG